MQNSLKGYKWLYIEQSGTVRSTHSNLMNLNPQCRGVFSTKEDAEAALNKWIEAYPTQQKEQYKLIEVF